MSTYLLTWNPAKYFKWEDLPQEAAEIAANGATFGNWSFGNRKNAQVGDRVFIIKQGAELPRGIVASGTIVEPPYENIHWADENRSALYVDIELDALLDPAVDSILLREELDKPAFSDMHWSAEASGTEIPDHVANALELKWIGILGENNKKPGARFQHKREFKKPNYWWVNHKQTYNDELGNGYVWSPKSNKNGAINQTYLNLLRTNVKDILFSYADGEIKAIGVVKGRCRSKDRPISSREVGEQWDKDGWLVPIDWMYLSTPFSPKNYIKQIAPLLPEKHSPIRNDGNGNQGCYLAAISEELGKLLTNIAQTRNAEIDSFLEEKEESMLNEVELVNIEYQEIPETQKEQLIKARVGQGLFRSRVIAVEKGCRLTDVTNKRFLIASHIKSWRESSNEERLDGNNGLLLSPHVDKLFDKGWISFSDDGEILCTDSKIKQLMTTWGLDYRKNVGNFNTKQKKYLAHHRNKFNFNQQL